MKRMSHLRMTRELQDKINQNRLELQVVGEPEDLEIKQFSNKDSTNNKDNNTRLNFK